MNIELRAKLLGKTEEEIRSEMAAALGRIGRKLQELLFSLQQQHVQIRNSPVHERDAQIAGYNEIRKQAKLYYWYLIVQRESLGIKSHIDVETSFTIPDALGTT